jgi:hypothetical protein
LKSVSMVDVEGRSWSGHCAPTALKRFDRVSNSYSMFYLSPYLFGLISYQVHVS